MNIILHKPSSTFGRTIGVLGALACMLSVSVAQAGTKCYDFSGPDVGTVYKEDQKLDTRHATINLQHFRTTSGPSTYGVQEAVISDFDHAQGGAPSLRMTSIVSQIVPKKPVKRITLKYAENTGGAYQQNFGVNGERKVLEGGLAQINKQTFGKQRFGGPAQVLVTSEPHGNFVRGTVEVNAARGGSIKYIAFGGSSQLFIDNVCMTEK